MIVFDSSGFLCCGLVLERAYLAAQLCIMIRELRYESWVYLTRGLFFRKLRICNLKAPSAQVLLLLVLLGEEANLFGVIFLFPRPGSAS